MANMRVTLHRIAMEHIETHLHLHALNFIQCLIYQTCTMFDQFRPRCHSLSFSSSWCAGFGRPNRLQVQKHAKIIPTPFNERKPCRQKHATLTLGSYANTGTGTASVTSAGASRRVYARNVRLHNALLHTCVLFAQNKHQETTQIQPNIEQCAERAHTHRQIHMHTYTRNNKNLINTSTITIN